MSLQLILMKFALQQFAKVAKAAPGTAAIGVESAATVGFGLSATKLDTNTEVYLPFIGRSDVNVRAISYTATTLGFLAGFGMIAAAAAGTVVAPGVSFLAIGMAAVAGLASATGNPDTMNEIFEKAQKIEDFLREKIASGELQAGEITPMDLSELVIPGGIGSDVNMCYRAAKTLPMPVDPLMLDLDGDGLELKSANGSVLFDHDGDGVRTGTGWIGADDGILVRDLDGDGFITSGRELFGDETLKGNGQRATNGFDALADLDSNHDGNFTSAGAAWGQVKVWRDLDQDGVSDAGELFTLEQLGISRIGVIGSTRNACGDSQAWMPTNGNAVVQSASCGQSGNGVAR